MSLVCRVIPCLDVAAGRVVVTPPAGLFEQLPDDETGAPDSESDETPDASADIDADVDTEATADPEA